MPSTSNAVASSRGRRDHDVAFFFQDAVDPRDRLLSLACRLNRERVVVLVLEVTGFVRAQARQRVGDR
jgi:hypothetical protein